MTQLSRNNHYLSRIYLEAWKNDDDKVLISKLKKIKDEKNTFASII